jgi:hypothetical protein
VLPECLWTLTLALGAVRSFMLWWGISVTAM